MFRSDNKGSFDSNNNQTGPGSGKVRRNDTDKRKPPVSRTSAKVKGSEKLNVGQPLRKPGSLPVDLGRPDDSLSLPARQYGTVIPNRIFVGGITEETKEHELKSVFEKYAKVVEVKIITDRGGVSKGRYGFVTFEREDDAQRILQMDEESKGNRFYCKNRKLNIGKAIRKQSKPFPEPILASGGVLSGPIYISNGVPYIYQNGTAHFLNPSDTPLIHSGQVAPAVMLLPAAQPPMVGQAQQYYTPMLVPQYPTGNAHAPMYYQVGPLPSEMNLHASYAPTYATVDDGQVRLVRRTCWDNDGQLFQDGGGVMTMSDMYHHHHPPVQGIVHQEMMDHATNMFNRLYIDEHQRTRAAFRQVDAGAPNRTPAILAGPLGNSGRAPKQQSIGKV